MIVMIIYSDHRSEYRSDFCGESSWCIIMVHHYGHHYGDNYSGYRNDYYMACTEIERRLRLFATIAIWRCCCV